MNTNIDIEPTNPFDLTASKNEIKKGKTDRYGVVYSADGKKLLHCTKDARKLKQYTIKPGTEIICNSAFACFEYLRKVSFPDGLKAIGDSAFFGCHLREISLPDSVEHISRLAFACITEIKALNIPRSLRFVGEEFVNCDIPSIRCSSPNFIIEDGILYTTDKSELVRALNLEHTHLLKIPESVRTIRDDALSTTRLEEITIPDSVTVIGNGAFSGNPFLNKVQLPNKMEQLGEFVFGVCHSLKQISIPEGIKVIPKRSFVHCINLTEVSLPSSLKEIAEGAFYRCAKLQRINFPNGLESIGAHAFGNCKKLTVPNLPRVQIDPTAFAVEPNLDGEAPS